MNLFFLKIILRNLVKRDVFSVINILGLSISLSVVLLMYLQIHHDISFDKSFNESKNIYRVNARWISSARKGETSAITTGGLAQTMKENIPGVEEAIRIWRRSHILKFGDFEADLRVNFTDEGFFDLFDTPILHGSANEALKRPDAMALSETMANRIFGNNNPVGELVLYGPQTMEIVAVFKDFPMNCSFYGFDIIAGNPPDYNSPGMKFFLNFETFVLLHENVDTASVGQQLRRIWSEEALVATGGEPAPFTYELQKLTDIHLRSSHVTGSATTMRGDIEKVKMLVLLAIIILLIACINYMNLATARAQKRTKEIGISKTVGAQRIELAFQLFIETGVLTALSFILALGLSYFLLPVFNLLMNAELNFGIVLNANFLFGALSILLLTTIIAASYPAFYLSGFPPLGAIKASTFRGSQSSIVRQTLSIFQFVAAIILISWVIVVYSQIKYINNKDMGYDLDQIIAFWIRTNPGPDFTPFENAFRAQSSVLQMSRVSYFPSIGDQTLLKKDLTDEGVLMQICNADEHMIDLLRLQMIAGKPLPPRLEGDTIAQIVLNRKAVEYLESSPEDVIGRTIITNFREPVVVCGVVENFNYENLFNPIGAYGIHNSRFGRGRFYLMARVSSHDLPAQLETYKKMFNEFYPNDMFDVRYPDLEMQRAYQGTKTTSQIALLFSILAILIACMGVFGLTAFMAEQRTKEIGIRKVMGATIWDIVKLFTANYVKLLLISLVIAIPAAWWVCNHYLQDFAYRISLSWWIFAAATLIIITLTMLTVSVLAIRAAMANPVKSITKCE